MWTEQRRYQNLELPEKGPNAILIFSVPSFSIAVKHSFIYQDKLEEVEVDHRRVVL